MSRHEIRFLECIAIISGVACFMIAITMIINHSVEFWYLPWNLFLAWVPLALSVALVKLPLSRWAKLLALAVWLAFLPNTFYIITDIIHITDRTRFSQLYDIAMLMTTIAAGYLAGILSLKLIDHRYIRRFSQLKRRLTLGTIALLSGIAIYIGRELRWNSWDLLVNPGGVIHDVARIISMPRPFAEAILGILASTMIIALSYFITLRSERSAR